LRHETREYRDGQKLSVTQSFIWLIRHEIYYCTVNHWKQDLEWNISHCFRQVVGFETVPVVQMFANKNEFFHGEREDSGHKRGKHEKKKREEQTASVVEDFTAVVSNAVI